MRILDRDQVKIKLGSYGVATSAALASALWVQKVRDYRRQLSARMVALDPPSLAKRLAPGTYHVSRKIDGEFTVLVWTGEEIFSLNPGGNRPRGFIALGGGKESAAEGWRGAGPYRG